MYKPVQKSWGSFKKKLTLWVETGVTAVSYKVFGMDECLIQWNLLHYVLKENNASHLVSSLRFLCVVYIYIFMRVDFLEGLFGCYCFQGFCLSGLRLIFHLHDISLGNLLQAWRRDGPYWSSLCSLQASVDLSAQWVQHFPFSSWELITHFSPDRLRCLFLQFRKIPLPVIFLKESF